MKTPNFLQKDEEVIMNIRRGNIILPSVLFLAPIFILAITLSSWFFYLIGFILLLYAILMKVKSKYILTNKRIIMVTGGFDTKIKDVFFENISNIEKKGNSLKIKEKDEKKKLKLHNISKGGEFYALVNNYL
jgi:hypothetical protein